MSLNSPFLILESRRFTAAAWTWTNTSFSRTSGPGISPIIRTPSFFPYRSAISAFMTIPPGPRPSFLEAFQSCPFDEIGCEAAHQRELFGLNRPDKTTFIVAEVADHGAPRLDSRLEIHSNIVPKGAKLVTDERDLLRDAIHDLRVPGYGSLNRTTDNGRLGFQNNRED